MIGPRPGRSTRSAFPSTPSEVGQASLLWRIADPAIGADRSGVGKVRSILRNLADVLNTRQGTASAQMDLGTLAPCDAMDAHDSMTERLQGSLREVISRYEPRLADVEVVHVRHVQEGFHLHFQVSARLSGTSERIGFRTLVDVAGRVMLRE